MWSSARERDQQRIQGVYYKRSHHFLRLARILDYALTRWFNAPHIAGRVRERVDRSILSKDRLRRVRQWLRRHASKYIDQDTQLCTVGGLMRAGEMDLYMDMHPGSVVSEPDVMAYYRRATFLTATEQALWPVSEIMDKAMASDLHFESSEDGHPFTQHETPQFASAALSIVKAQLRMASPHVNVDHVIMSSDDELRRYAGRLDTAITKWPVLVVCCNRMHVWWRGELHMFQSVLDSLVAFVWWLESECGNKIGGYSVQTMVDAAFHADETPEQTLMRHNPRLKRSLGVDTSGPAPSIARPVRFDVVN